MVTVTASLSTLLLGQASDQRLRASQSLLALAAAAVFAVVQQGEVMLGLLNQQASNLLSLGYLGGLLVFYLLIRLGLNRRVVSDPSLTLPQTFYGTACLAWSYGIHGPTRGAVLMIMLFVIIYGMFSLTARQATTLGVFAFLALGVSVACKAMLDPLGFEPRVELVHLSLLCVTLIGSSIVSVRLGQMRRRLSAQKVALQDALSRISLLATHDELTGLLNRRAMLQALGGEVGRRALSAAPLSLAIIDLDHFKRINDEHGHQAGDTVLHSFGHIAQGAVRGADVLARWGGEEFLLMLPDTAAADALVVLERVRQSLAAHSFDSVAPGLVVTFSAGVSECASAEDVQPCIERADQALYRAKHGGRNRSLMADPPTA